jgi:hypothetical protein
MSIRVKVPHKQTQCYLGDGEEILRDVNNILHLFHGFNPIGDCLGVFGPCILQQGFDVL